MRIPPPPLSRALLPVASLSVIGALVLLGPHAARIGPLDVPVVSPWWCLGLAALVFLGVRQSTHPLGPFRFLLSLLALAALAMPLASWRHDLLRPASPLPARVYRPSLPGSAEGSVLIDSLRLEERRFLNRLTDRRRDVGLEVSGFVWIPREGSYRFELGCDDHCSLLVDGRRLAERAGVAVVGVDLQEGVYPFELRYEQSGGPASFRLRWDRPAWVELLPLESYVAGERSALPDRRASLRGLAVWSGFAVGLAWLLSSSLLLVRAGQSRRAWWSELRGGLASWYRKPEPASPVALVRGSTWLAASAGLGSLALLAWWGKSALRRGAFERYENVPMRLELALERVEAYPSFLLFVAAMCAAVAAVFLSRLTFARAFSRAALEVILLASIVGALTFGAYVSQREWVRRDRPCWDGYCDFAESVRGVLTEPGSDSVDGLRRYLAGNYHANSPVGPFLIATVSLLGPDIVTSYRLLSAAATLGSLLLLHRIARRYLGLEAVPALVAAFLFAAAGPIQRSFLFPQTDAVMMLFFTLALERLLALRAGPSPTRTLGLAFALLAALLTKLSGLPLIGIAALGVFLPGPGESWQRVLGLSPGPDGAGVASRLFRRGRRVAPVVGVPLIGVFLYTSWLDTSNAFNRELHRMETVDSTLGLHAVATLVTLLPLVAALLSSVRRPFPGDQIFLLAAIVVYLVGLVASGASGWERFYINLLPSALPLAVARLAPLPGLGNPLNVAVLSAAYALAHGVRMLLHAFSSG